MKITSAKTRQLISDYNKNNVITASTFSKIINKSDSFERTKNISFHGFYYYKISKMSDAFDPLNASSAIYVMSGGR